MAISARHALTDQEFSFVRIYAGFGEKNAAEAYRRAFCILGPDGEYYLRTEKGEAAGEPLNARAVGKRATALLNQDYIQSVLTELKRAPGEAARAVLAEQTLFSADGQALRAAQRVLADEDKLGFRDAVDQWAMVVCAIGTEVVVPLPGGGEVAFPLREMFPRYRDALPPVDVLLKTEKALRGYREKLEAEEAAGAG